MEPETKVKSRWPVVVAILGLAAIGLAAFVFYQSKRLPLDLMEEGSSLARAFRSGTVTTRFISYATEVSGQNHLQFATLKEMEVFERTDSATVLWGQLKLPDVVVRARAPVEYTYYLDLNEPWELTLDDRLVTVRTPSIRFNSPAIDVSEIHYEVASGSMLRDEDVALQNLARGLSGLAKQRAQQNIALVREVGRKKTEEFIRNWLLAQYEDADTYRVEVIFADESVEGPRPSPLNPR
jgi:hypothetical protein